MSAVVPTSPWAERLAAMTGQDRDADDVLPGDPLQAVARAEANADAAVAIARLGVLEAERALLAAKAAVVAAAFRSRWDRTPSSNPAPTWSSWRLAAKSC